MSNAATRGELPLLVVGGVPEHFNEPWHMAERMGLFARQGVRVRFVECGMGTGDMIRRCHSGELDLVVALTEGLVADAAGRGSELRLVGTYVESPLCWALSVSPSSRFRSADSLRGGTFGVSRLLSGSHLMAAVMADDLGWRVPEDVSFEVLGSFADLRRGVLEGRADAFLWETFTTKPWHDSGELRRAGEVTTRWPAFSMAARASALAAPSFAAAVSAALSAVREACVEFRRRPAASARLVASAYGLPERDAAEWFSRTTVSATPAVRAEALADVLGALERVGAVPASVARDPSTPARLVAPGLAVLVAGGPSPPAPRPQPCAGATRLASMWRAPGGGGHPSVF